MTKAALKVAGFERCEKKLLAGHISWSVCSPRVIPSMPPSNFVHFWQKVLQHGRAESRRSLQTFLEAKICHAYFITFQTLLTEETTL
jgi:hypothetical protein